MVTALRAKGGGGKAARAGGGGGAAVGINAAGAGPQRTEAELSAPVMSIERSLRLGKLQRQREVLQARGRRDFSKFAGGNVARVRAAMEASKAAGPAFRPFTPGQLRDIAASSGRVRGKSMFGGKAVSNQAEVMTAAAANVRRTGKNLFVYATHTGFKFGSTRPSGQVHFEISLTGFRKLER